MEILIFTILKIENRSVDGKENFPETVRNRTKNNGNGNAQRSSTEIQAIRFVQIVDYLLGYYIMYVKLSKSTY